MIYKITTTRTFETEDHDTAQSYLNDLAERNLYTEELEVDEMAARAGEKAIQDTGILDAGTTFTNRMTTAVKVEALGGKL